jgi:hypothetical protein
MLPHTKKASDHSEQVSQDNQKLPLAIYQETNVPMIEAFGEKIYENLCSVASSLRTENPFILDSVDSWF